MVATLAAQEGESPFGTQALSVGVVDTAAQPQSSTNDNMSDRDLKDLHTKLIEMFESSEDASRSNRERAERDDDYYHNKQWTEDDVRELEKQGQPAISKNRIKRKIRYMLGLEQDKRTDPRALPRTPNHDFDAQDITDALRFVTQSNRYDRIRSSSFRSQAIVGWGGVTVTVEPKDDGNPLIKLEASKWDRMFWDPYSAQIDYSDAGYLGEVLWMDREGAVLKYGADAAKVFDETISGYSNGSTFDDKPKTFTWASYSKRWRVRIVKIYYLGDDGKWYFAEYTKGGFLKYGLSPYLDDEGKPEHEYVWRSYEIDRDNQRYGEVRGMIDTQDEINKRASKLLHLVSVRQTFGNAMAEGNQTVRQKREQLAKPDGHIDIGSGEFGKDFGVIPTGDMAQAQMELLQLNMQESDLEGPNAAMLGKGPAGASGRSILANQAGGALEAGPAFDTLKDMDHEVYRKIWRRIRQFWTAEEWIRVTDNDRNIRWVGLNTPRTQQVQMPGGQVYEMPMVDPMTGQPTLQNAVAELDIDIIIDDAPHVGTMQQEEFQALAQAANSPIGQLPSYPKMLIRASSFREKAEMLEDISKLEEAAANKPDPAQAQAQAEMQMEQQKAQAQLQLEVAKTQAQLQAKQAETAANLEAKRLEQEQDLAFEREKFAMELQYMREKAELDQQTRSAIAAEQVKKAKQTKPETRQ